MTFNKFYAYFNNPISTTTSLQSAHAFTCGSGIILSLKRAKGQYKNASEIPKYLSVSFMSNFPRENEKLFYGSNVQFSITNIHNIVGPEFQSNSKELSILNKFQQTIQNEAVKWDKNDEEMCNILTDLINSKYKDDEKISGFSEYGKKLFDYFCDNVTWVCIRNFKTLHTLSYTLFKNDDNISSIIPLLQLFPDLKEIVLNEIDIEDMIYDGDDYVTMILEHICDPDKFYGQYLKQISFKSKQRNNDKEIAVLTKLKNSYFTTFKSHLWTIKYQFQFEETHNLIFINDIIETADKIEKLEDN
eukprot:282694_1